MGNKKLKSDIAGYILSFLLPAIMMMISFAVIGIYPGGELTPLILDLRAQQLPFFNFLNNFSSGFNSLSYQSLGALGGGVIDPIQMCCSPLFFLFKSFDYKDIPWLIWGIIVCLIGMCGLSEFCYLKKGYPALDDTWKALLLSSSYGLMSCSIIYTLVPVWLWGLILLPVIALGIDSILDRNKYSLFVIAIFLSIVLNYYMAYILIIFSVIYFIYRSLLLAYGRKIFFIKSVRVIFAGLISVLLSAFSWMPVVYDLLQGKAVENRHFTYGIIRNPFKTMLQFLPMSYDGIAKHSLPFVFCGTLSGILLVLYFFDKREAIRDKVISGAVLVFFVLCFSIGILDISWMFFSEPNGYPSRYSYVFSFFVLIIASRKLKLTSIKIRCDLRTLLRVLIAVIVFIDLTLNSVYILRSINETAGFYSRYDEYIRVFNTMSRIDGQWNISDSNSRTVKNWRYTNNDGILFGYEDLDYSSSSYNFSMHEFMEDLGMNGQYHLIRSTGITPVVASILGVDYFIQYGNSLEDYYSYLGSVDGLDIYQNDFSLPVAYSVDKLSDDICPFTDNPFENINIMMRELSGSDPIFKMVDYACDGNTVSVFTNDENHLWMYAHPLYTSSSDIQLDSNGSLYYLFEDGIPVCEFANSVSPYCVDLGTSDKEEISFSFNQVTKLESLYLASYDSDIANHALDLLNENSAYDIFSSSKGIIFSVDMDPEKDLLITLPYMKGYSIYVDGKKTDYSSYRDSLILIDTGSGHHDVVIIYKTPGLIFGIMISLIAFLGLTVFICLERGEYIKNLKRKAVSVGIYKNIIPKIVISIFLSFLLMAGYAVKKNFTGSISALGIIGFILSMILIYCFTSVLYSLFGKSYIVLKKISSKKIFFISFLILIILYSIEFLGLYPGIFAFDAPGQIQMYFTNTISEWHPVAHTVFLGKMFEVAYILFGDAMTGVALSTIIQYSVIAICFSYMLKYVYDKTGRIGLWMVSTLFLGAFPTISLQVLSATKDSFFMGFYILTMTLSLELLSDADEFIKSRFKPFIWVISTFFMIIMRNNCIYVFPIFAVLILFICRRKKTALILLGSVTVLFVLYKTIYVPSYVTVDVDGREIYSLPAQQLAAVYQDPQSVVSNDERKIIENLIEESGFIGFVPESADAVKAALNMDYYENNKSLVNRCYLDILVKNSGIAIKTFAKLTCGFWYPIYDLTLYGQGGKGYWVIGSFSPYYINSKIPSLLHFYQLFGSTDFSKILLMPFYLLFAPALYFYIFVIMFGYAIVRRNKPFLFLFGFTTAFWLTYMLGPMALVRYTTYLFAIVPLYFVLVTEDSRLKTEQLSSDIENLIFEQEDYGSERFVDKDFSSLMRFISAVMIMLGHICLDGWYSFVFCGWLWTSVFFFYSGYGTKYSFDNKDDYSKGYLGKKIKNVWLPYITMNTIFYLVYCVEFGYRIKVDSIILSFLGIKVSNPILWYCVEIMILYCISYVLNKLKFDRIFVWIILLSIFILISLFFGVETYWYLSTSSYLIGLIYANKPYKINKLLGRSFAFLFISLYFVFIYLKGPVSFAFNDSVIYIYVLSILQMILVPVFIHLIMFLSGKIKIQLFDARLLGKMAYPIYLSHILFHICFKNLDLPYSLVILLVLTFTFIFSSIYVLLFEFINKPSSVEYNKSY